MLTQQSDGLSYCIMNQIYLILMAGEELLPDSSVGQKDAALYLLCSAASNIVCRGK
jgi:hypothetical protein